ncbi:MAG TPA: glycosyltransferase [Vicinamibacterales bacterium]|nr:glycosyltransferase [Vicinamibacterales bacterium]
MAQRFTAAPTQAAHASERAPSISPKILLYSHDTFGLGNIRRTLLLAETLGEEYPGASLLIVTGSPMIHAFRIPPRTDYIKLPCLTRSHADRYDPAYLSAYPAEIGDIRRGVLERSILGFAPDLMIVDKRAGGIDGELIEPLRALKRQGLPTRIVLGLRDIIDSPAATRVSLRRARDMQTIARYYDEVWIYGERALFDAVAEYRFPPDVARKTRFCGYLKRPTHRSGPHDGPPRALVTPGGGEDGTELVETYLAGLETLPRSVALQTTVVFGPQMPSAAREQLRRRFGRLADVEFLDFEPDLSSRYASVDVVVAMAGYNTVCELLSCAHRAVLVPRSAPVSEQLLRARLLAARGLFDLVEPQSLRPDVLIEAVLRALTRGPVEPPIDLDGLPRIRSRVARLLEAGA